MKIKAVKGVLGCALALAATMAVRADDVAFDELLDNDELAFQDTTWEGEPRPYYFAQPDATAVGGSALLARGYCSLGIEGFSGVGVLSFRYRTSGKCWAEYDADEESSYRFVRLTTSSEWKEVRAEFHGTSWQRLYIYMSCYGRDSAILIDNVRWTPATSPMQVRYVIGGGKADHAEEALPGDAMEWRYEDLYKTYGEVDYDDWIVENLNRPGWLFGGWHKDTLHLLPIVLDEKEYIPFSGTTLYAKWVRNLAEVMNTSTLSFSYATELNLGYKGCGYDVVAEPWYGTELKAPNGGPVAQALLPQFREWYDETSGGWTEVCHGGKLQASVKGKGYFSYYQLAHSPRMDFSVDFKEVDAESLGSDGVWNRKGVVLDSGTHTIDWVGMFYGEATPHTLTVGGVEFEPYGPQHTFGAWTEKLLCYESWVVNDISRFNSVYALKATHKDVILHALTTLLKGGEDGTLVSTFGQYGVALDYFHFALVGDAHCNTPVEGNELVDRAMNVGKPLIESALADLESLPAGFSPVKFTREDIGGMDNDVYVDFGDVLYARAMLKAMLSAVYYAKGYDMGVDYDEIRGCIQNGCDPSLNGQKDLAGKVRDANALAMSRGLAMESLRLAKDADAYVCNRSDSQLHVIEYDGEDADQQQTLKVFRDNIDKAISSIGGTTESFEWKSACTDQTKLPAMENPLQVNLASLFSGRILRSSVPGSLWTDRYAPNLDTMTDPTAGGVLPSFAKVATWDNVFISVGMVNGQDYAFSGVEPSPVDPVRPPPTGDFSPLKAQYDGLVWDMSSHTVAGIVQLKAAKMNTQKRTTKITGTLIGLDGKKTTLKAVEKSMVVPESGPMTVHFTAKNWPGQLEVTIGGTEFSGKISDQYVIQNCPVGGNVAVSTVTVDFANGFSDIPGEVQTELLPSAVPVGMSNGKWSFAKAATVKWTKDKATKEYGLVIDQGKDGSKSNKSGIKLSYTAKTGLFKGSFKLYSLVEQNGGKKSLKKYTVNVTGVVVNGKAYGTALLKKPLSKWPVEVK